MNSNRERNIEILKLWVGDEWAAQLAPLTKLEYFDNLVEFLSKIYDEGLIYPSISPTKKLSIFMPFKLTKPNNIHTIIFNTSVPFSEGSNGIGFGSYATPTLTYNEVKKEIETRNGTKITMDPTLISWLRQGVLILNYTPMVGFGSTSAVGCFDYFYKNVISVVDSLNSKKITVVTTSLALDEAVEAMDLPRTITHIKNARFTMNVLGKTNPFIFEELDNHYAEQKQESVTWYTE